MARLLSGGLGLVFVGFLLGVSFNQRVLAYPGDVFVNAAPVRGTPERKTVDFPVGTYSVSSRTGAAQYSLPIFAPPGRQGLQPSIALTYSSQNPIRGGVAVGWGLNVPTIRVDTSFGRLGQATYVSSLAGGQRLVPVDEPAAVVGVIAFRARNDASYTRYENVPDGSGESYWRALQPDGTIYTFGRTPTSRDRPSEYGAANRWFVTTIVDRFGNEINFTYETVRGAALNGRLADIPVDIALAEISYTRNQQANLAAHARIRFEYVDGLEVCPDSHVPIGAKFDYRSGIRTYEGARRLESIVVEVRASPEQEWKSRRQIDLTYDAEALRCDKPRAPLRLITAVQERGWNSAGEETVLPPLMFEYSRISHDFVEMKPIEALGRQTRQSAGFGKRRLNDSKAGGWPTIEGMFIDLDGDGRTNWLRSFETDNDPVCRFEWDGTFSLLPALPWANTETVESGFGSRNTDTSNLQLLEGCSLAFQLSRRTNRPKNESETGTICPGVGANYTSYRLMDLDGDGDQDLVTALDYKRGRYIPANDAALQNENRFGRPPNCSLSPPCRDPAGNPTPCRTDSLIGALTMGLPTPSALVIGDSPIADDGGNFPNPMQCPGGTSPAPGFCPEPHGNCGCIPDMCPQGSVRPITCHTGGICDCITVPGSVGSEWEPPEDADDNAWQGMPYTGGDVGGEDRPSSSGGNPWCAQEPEMACPSSSGFSSYVWRVYWNGGKPNVKAADSQQCTKTLPNGLEIPAPCPPSEVGVPVPSNVSDIFGATKAPDLVFSPIPLESDRPTSSLGAGALAASSSWHGFIDIDGDGYLDAVWQEPTTRGRAGITPTGYPDNGPTGRFLAFRGDGTGHFRPDADGNPYEWRTPPLGEHLRARVNLRRSRDKYPLRSFNHRLLNNEIHRFTETVATLQDINGDGLPDYVESREEKGGVGRLRVFYNTGRGFEHGTAGNLAGTTLTSDFATMSREETVVLTVESNMQMKNGWSMSVRRLVDLDQDGLPDVAAIRPPVVGQSDPWIYPTAIGELYDFDGIPQAVIDRFIDVPLDEAQQAPVIAYINMGDRLVNVGEHASLNQWRDGLARLQLSSHDEWVVKADLLDFDGDGLDDLYNNDHHQLGGCQPTPRAGFLGSPLHDQTGGQYNLQFCGLSDQVRGDPDANNGMRLLTHVDNGRGGEVRFAYAPQSDEQVVRRTAATSGRVPHPLWVVHSLTVDPGHAPVATTDYLYSDPVMNHDDFGKYAFRGFKSALIQLPPNESGARQTREERFDYALDYSGRLTDRLTFDEAGNLHQVETTKWRRFDLYGGRVETFHRGELATWTCDSSNQESEAACRQSGALRREISYFAPLPRRLNTGAGAPTGFQIEAPQDGRVVAVRIRSERRGSTVTPFHEGLSPSSEVLGVGATPIPDPVADPLCATADDVYPSSANASPDDTVPATIVVTCAERLTDRPGGVSLGDRGKQFAYDLVYGADTYHLLPTETKRIVAEEAPLSGWGATRTVGRTRTLYDPGKLGLRRETQEWLDDATIGVTRRTYDDLTGNLKTVQSPVQVALGSDLRSTYEYDKTYRIHVTDVTNELGHLVTTDTDIATGRPLRIQGPLQPGGGRPEEMTIYDGFGRIREQHRSTDAPGGGYATELYLQQDYFDSETPVRIREIRLIDYGTDKAITTDRTYDGLGRPLAEQVTTLNGPATTTYEYDAAGNIVRVSMPNPRAGATGPAEYHYRHDYKGRVTRWTPPIGAEIEVTYDGLKSTHAELPSDDSTASARTLEQDVFRRLRKVTELTADGIDAITQYSYDANDNMSLIHDADDVITELVYDMAGRRISVTRAGPTWSYKYDQNNNLIAKIAPHPTGEEAAYTSRFTYDAINRILTSTPGERDLTPSEQSRYRHGETAYEYDLAGHGSAVGRLARVTLPFATIDYSYTVEGWVSKERRAFDVDPFADGGIADVRTITTHYNALGKAIRTVHADDIQNPTVTSLAYDERGLPVAVTADLVSPSGTVPTSTVLAAFTRNLAGAPISRDFFGQRQTWAYDDMGRVTEDEVVGANETVAGERLDIDAVGNPRRITDLATNRAIDYTYDTQHQLVTATSDDASSYVASFTYWPTGRVNHVRIKSDAPGTSVQSRDVVHHYEPQPEDSFPSDPSAVRRLVSAGGGEFARYDYDRSGNVAHKAVGTAAWDFVYDGDDRLREVIATVAGTIVGRVAYFYDHTGRRTLAVISPATQSVKSRLWFGETEIHYPADGSPFERWVDVEVGGLPVARIKGKDAKDVEFAYHGILRDLLVALDNSGRVLARFSYSPYGDLLASQGPGTGRYRRRFNDKEFDDLSTLRYYGFRYYDALSLTWMQADPLYRFVPDIALGEPRRLNLYAFSLNNPLRYFDADGRCPTTDAPNGAGCGGHIMVRNHEVFSVMAAAADAAMAVQLAQGGYTRANALRIRPAPSERPNLLRSGTRPSIFRRIFSVTKNNEKSGLTNESAIGTIVRNSGKSIRRAIPLANEAGLNQGQAVSVIQRVLGDAGKTSKQVPGPNGSVYLLGRYEGPNQPVLEVKADGTARLGSGTVDINRETLAVSVSDITF